MPLAIFDLDDTLIPTDSNLEWGRLLIDEGIVEPSWETLHQAFDRDYAVGKLDMTAYLEFMLAPLADFDPEMLEHWQVKFLERMRPFIPQAAHELIQQHREGGDTLLIITGTNRFIASPLADAFGVDALLASECEIVQGRYTGKSIGIPCYGKGKIAHLNKWLVKNPHAMTGSWFYSDSHNDLPLLEWVSNPVAVNPDRTLERHATKLGWHKTTIA